MRRNLPTSGHAAAAGILRVMNPNLLNRIRAEFLEMPGLRLTVSQVQRLCGIDAAACRAVLDALVDAKFLSVKSNSYFRASDGVFPTPRFLKINRFSERARTAS